MLGGHIVIIILDYHILELRIGIARLRRSVGTRHAYTYHKARIEFLRHYIHREIVVNAAVIDQYAIHLNRLKHKREAH